MVTSERALRSDRKLAGDIHNATINPNRGDPSGSYRKALCTYDNRAACRRIYWGISGLRVGFAITDRLRFCDMLDAMRLGRAAAVCVIGGTYIAEMSRRTLSYFAKYCLFSTNGGDRPPIYVGPVDRRAARFLISPSAVHRVASCQTAPIPVEAS